MITIFLLPLIVGLNLSIWGLVSGLRRIDESVRRRRRDHLDCECVTLSQLAVLMPAHNEELVIENSLARLLKLIPAANVHVVSDSSTDRTVQLARARGAAVVETPVNLGKAGALAFALEHFELLDRFAAVMILDADTELDPHYFDVALPLLDDPRVAAVAGCAHTRWQRRLGVLGHVLVAHRQRIYVLTQLLIKYGQTWRGVSATHIVPGFASIYRSRVLREITIDPVGLVIEDFNMTFELHAKRLGRIAFHPQARAYTQDPNRYQDYVRQVRRWALGLWQTLRRHRIDASVFGLSLAVTLVELITSSLLFIALPLIVAMVAVADLAPAVTSTPVLGEVIGAVGNRVTLTEVLLGIVVPDYLLTCVVAAVERQLSYLLAGLLFIPLKITDAALALYTLPRAWLDRSNGRWVSPTRRAIETPEVTDVA